MAATFAEMQEARHKADYKPDERFFREDVVSQIQSVEDAFEKWNDVKSHPVATIYLASFLFRWR
ncbi:MAG: hypothetical protein ACKV0T_02845 [Planctomycetales bacterium]